MLIFYSPSNAPMLQQSILTATPFPLSQHFVGKRSFGTAIIADVWSSISLITKNSNSSGVERLLKLYILLTNPSVPVNSIKRHVGPYSLIFLLFFSYRDRRWGSGSTEDRASPPSITMIVAHFQYLSYRWKVNTRINKWYLTKIMWDIAKRFKFDILHEDHPKLNY